MQESDHSTDARWMNRAIEIAIKGQGMVEPNPMVGCVIACRDELLAEGYHKQFGGPHAEIEAISQLRSLPLNDTTVYVTLEPCCHSGKTPPCTQALIEAGVHNVVVGYVDPNPTVAGQGIKQLRDSGINVRVGICEAECKRLVAPFEKVVTTGIPWVIAKWAMTLDGKIATKTGDSKWISGAESRQLVHQIRSRVDAIIVGSRTVQADDPLLTARNVKPKRCATRIVVDSRLTIPANSRLIKTAKEFPVLIVAGPEAEQQKISQLTEAGCEVWSPELPDSSGRMKSLLQFLGRRGMTNLLVEGGGGLLGEFFDAKLVDEVHCFISPKLVGGANAPTPVGGNGLKSMSDALKLDHIRIQTLESDVYMSGLVRH